MQLVMASQSVIDAVAVSLLADMERLTIHPTTELPPSVNVDVSTTALESTVEALRASLCSLVKIACEKRNSRLPINRLPVELLAIIFQLVVDSCTPDLHIRSARTLALVATHWKEIVDLTPSLWATVCGSYSLSTVTTALTKSKHSPLAVHSTGYGVPGLQQMDDILQIIQPHIYRLQIVHLRLHHPRQLLLLNTPAPKLQSLHLYIQRRSHPTAAPINIFSGSTGSLEDVHLDGIQIPWESEMLPRLRSLNISHIRGPRSEMSFSAIMQILAQCPELKDLELVRLDLLLTDQPEGLTTVHASCLDRLYISYLPYLFFRSFVASVTTARLTSITLGPPTTTSGDDATALSLDTLRCDKKSESAPDMQQVSIKELAINWTSGALKGLHLLSIDDITQGAPTSEQLMVVLKENPSLEVLQLWSINVIPPVGRSSTPPVITLSQLREASLYNLPFDFANTILSAILAPQIETCYISMTLSSGLLPSIVAIDSPRSIVQDHAPLGLRIKQAFSTSPKISVSVSSNGDVTVGSYEIPPVVLVMLREGGVPATVALASQLISILHSDHLPLELSFDDEDEHRNFTVHTLRHISDMLPQTTEIDFGAEFTDLAPLFQFMATPNVGPEQNWSSWPLPMLTSIHATSRVSFPGALAMVQGRAGFHLAGQEEGVEFPVALESITFDYQEEELTTEELEAMEAVVGPGVFYWDCSD